MTSQILGNIKFSRVLDARSIIPRRLNIASWPQMTRWVTVKTIDQHDKQAEYASEFVEFIGWLPRKVYLNPFAETTGRILGFAINLLIEKLNYHFRDPI